MPAQSPTQAACGLPAAHRGVPELDNRALPTNSAAAVKRSLELGVVLFELDIRLSTDGELYLFHDKMLNPKWWIFPQKLERLQSSQFSSADVRLIRHRIPSGFKAAPGDDAVAFFGALGPLFEPPTPKSESPDRSAANKPGLLLLDLKGNFSSVLSPLIAAAAANGLEHRTIIQCYSAEQLAEVRSRAPQFAVMARISPELTLEQAYRHKPEIFQLDPGAAGRLTVAAIRKKGAKILIKSLSDDRVENWDRLIEQRADFILTDHAAELLAIQKDSGQKDSGQKESGRRLPGPILSGQKTAVQP